METLAATADRGSGVMVVPAFTGLGAPHWDPAARGAILGLTLGSSVADIARATVDAMAYQVADVLAAMALDAGGELDALRVDGGAAVNDSLLQFQADILRVPVERPRVTETTALGAAFLAGLGTGFWSSTDEVAATWQLDRRFEPQMAQTGARAPAGPLAPGRRSRQGLDTGLAPRRPWPGAATGRSSPPGRRHRRRAASPAGECRR